MVNLNASRFCLILIVTIFSIGCKKDKLENEKVLLSGSWKWTYTMQTYGWCDGSVNYNVITPVDYGSEHSISFLEKGKIIFYKNGVKEKKYRIVFEHFSYLEDSHYAFQIVLNNDTTKIIEGAVNHDTLNIKYPLVEEDPNCENYLNFFVRE